MKLTYGLFAAAAAVAAAAPKLITIPPMDPSERTVSAIQQSGGSDTSTFTITQPGQAPVPFPHANALFGIPMYGSSISGPLYYPQSDPTGCSSITDPNIPNNAILLLDRGNCTYTAKVLNAQYAGAMGAIVVDNLGICGIDASCDEYGDQCWGCPYFEVVQQCECGLHFMGDSGNGNLVNIPSFMIGRVDGQTIKNALVATPLQAAMAWDLPNAQGQVEMEIWGHADDMFAYTLRESLYPYFQYYGNSLAVTPHWFVWFGPDSGCGVAGTCGNQCLNNEYYCSLDPDGDMSKGASGADVVMETVRQMCLWQQVSNSSSFATNHGQPFWAYANAVVMTCNATFSQACSESLMRSMGFNVPDIQACVLFANSTFDPDNNVYMNKLLQQEVDLRDEMEIVRLPTVVVNDVILVGSHVPSVVFGAVCAGYGADKIPQVCQCTDVPSNQLASCMGASSTTPDKGLPGWGIAIIIVVVFSIVGIGAASWYFYKRTTTQVKDMLDDYRQLVDTGESEQSELKGANAGETRLAERIRQLTAVPQTGAPAAGSINGQL